MSGWSPFVYDNNSVRVVNRVNSELHENALSAGYQFVEYLAPNGVVLSIEVDPSYDDPVTHKIPYYNGQGVAYSYRYDILDIGSMNQPNIFKVGVKGMDDIRGILHGPRDPYTGKQSFDTMSWDEDSADFTKMSTLGVCILDPMRTMSIIPNILRSAL